MTSDPTPLKNFLLERLRRSGRMTFEEYMRECLYHPQFGYYMQGRERTGIGGDFFTSCDLHPIFARLVARQAVEMWEILARPGKFTWVEMGAGRGCFAHDFLEWARESRPDFYAVVDYVAIEPALHQRERVLERVGARFQKMAFRMMASLEELEPITGCFFSNEVVDAFPVHIVTRLGGRLREIYVTGWGGELREEPGPISDPNVAASVARYAKDLEEGQRVEVNLMVTGWMRAMRERLASGFVLTADYGDLAHHLYTPDRPRGTLMAYCRHRASEDFFSAPGELDLTAQVNFSALMDAGRAAGLEVTGFTTQERFLMALGEVNEFADLYDPSQSEEEKLRARLKLKRLIHPADMGTVFKVLIQHRGSATSPLTGLKFESQ